MITDSYREFFAASTGASAALIGLLFVAVSVAPARLSAADTRVEAQVRAGAALIAFTNVVLISLIALIPDTNIGWAVIAVGVSGVLYSASSGRWLRDDIRRGHGTWRSFSLIIVLVLVFGAEIVHGVVLVIHPHDASAVSWIAGLLIGSLTLGIARSWELVGMRDTGLVSSMTNLVRGVDLADEDPSQPAPPHQSSPTS